MKREHTQQNPVNQPGSPALEVLHLSKHFELGETSTLVLDDITFCAGAGELVCIIGCSGCGKTTLLNILAGFIPPGSGSVKMDGNPIERPGPERCVVFQEDALFPWLSVRENIAFGLKRRMKKKLLDLEVERFLALVGLNEFRDHLPCEISGGMKQRVALARVLILKPQVLLMDEPFVSLDYHLRKEMQNLLVSLWKELGQTIIFVTHDIDEAITLADRIIVMDIAPGRINQEFNVGLPRPRSEEQTGYIFFRKKLLSSYGALSFNPDQTTIRDNPQEVWGGNPVSKHCSSSKASGRMHNPEIICQLFDNQDKAIGRKRYPES
ncbi:MAG: ABC transporter ATP-binding protein [Deltaproteobacteria bacterium]|nr:ABC transporter ATP-binding protein [Deltaproteobacteria bacterium]